MTQKIFDKIVNCPRASLYKRIGTYRKSNWNNMIQTFCETCSPLTVARDSDSFTAVAAAATTALRFFVIFSSMFSLAFGTLGDFARLGDFGDLGDTRFGDSCNVDRNVGAFFHSSSKCIATVRSFKTYQRCNGMPAPLF